ncbi:MAG: MarR family transcriptional regulator [Victivallales bacterium]|jgi:hypothetical protein
MNGSEEIATRFWKTVFALTDLMRDMSGHSVVAEDGDNWNLTIQQMRLLRVVYVKTSTTSPEGVMLKSIAETLNVTSAAVCGMVENMVQRGLLTRNRCESNRRSVNISLSEYSLKKIRELESGFTRIAEQMCAKQGKEEMTRLIDILGNLTAELVAENPSSYQAQLLKHFK